MTAPANRWKLGLFVVSGCAATMLGAAWIGAGKLQRVVHPAYAYFDEALTGLEEGSPVKFRGITIGVVRRIKVAEDKKHLRVEASLYEDKVEDIGLDVTNLAQACQTLRAQVVMSWVTNTSFIQVDFFPDPASGPQQLPFSVPAYEITIRTVPSTAKSLEAASRDVLRELPSIASSARELVELLRSELQAAMVPQLTKELTTLLQRVDGFVSDLQQRGVIANVNTTLDSVRAAATDAVGTLRDEQSPFGVTLAELRGLATDLRRQVEGARIAETAASMRAATGQVGAVGEAVRTELVQFRATLAAVERLAALLERDPGSLLHGRGATRPATEIPR
jgi:paraquat-inducible protein B